MSPEDRRDVEELKTNVKKLMEVLDVPFIENVKRRCVTPAISDLGLTETVSKTGDGDTTGVLKGVSEAGSATYDVANEYDGTITVRDTQGTSYKLGYYTP